MRSFPPIVRALLVCLIAGGLVQGQSAWKLSKTLHLGGEGGWDYVTAGPDNHPLFVPRSTHTMILDAGSGKILGDVPGQKIAHGVAIVNYARGVFH
jgi:hypothetical protein